MVIPAKEQVYQCIVNLTLIGRQASRQGVARETGLKYSVVDDHVRHLREDGRIRLVLNGVYEPVVMFDELAVSSTVLSDGRVKLECGDEVMTLTPKMARNVVAVLGGFALLFGR